MFPSEETFYLVEEPNADRRYVWRAISPEFFKQLKDRGAKIFSVTVLLPTTPTELDGSITTVGVRVQDPPGS